MEEITTVISTVGFPIAMALLLYRQNTVVLKEVTDGMQSLKEAIVKLTTVIDKEEK